MAGTDGRFMGGLQRASRMWKCNRPIALPGMVPSQNEWVQSRACTRTATRRRPPVRKRFPGPDATQRAADPSPASRSRMSSTLLVPKVKHGDWQAGVGQTSARGRTRRPHLFRDGIRHPSRQSVLLCGRRARTFSRRRRLGVLQDSGQRRTRPSPAPARLLTARDAGSP